MVILPLLLFDGSEKLSERERKKKLGLWKRRRTKMSVASNMQLEIEFKARNFESRLLSVLKEEFRLWIRQFQQENPRTNKVRF